MPGFIHSVYSREGSETSVTSVDSTISDKPPIMSTLQGETHVFFQRPVFYRVSSLYLSLLSPFSQKRTAMSTPDICFCYQHKYRILQLYESGISPRVNLGRPGSFPSVDTGKNFSYPGSYCCIHLWLLAEYYMPYIHQRHILFAIVLISYLKTNRIVIYSECNIQSVSFLVFKRIGPFKGFIDTMTAFSRYHLVIIDGSVLPCSRFQLQISIKPSEHLFPTPVLFGKG